MTVLEFFETLWGDDLPGEIVLWSSDTKKSTWCPSIEAAAKEAAKLSKKQNVFAGMGLQSWELAQKSKTDATRSNTRGSENSVVAIPGFWCDIDIAGDGHKEDKLPGTVEEAVELAHRIPLPPTLIVHTGGGIHAHWLFNEPLELEENDERGVAKHLLTRLQYSLQVAAREKGWEIDSTYDLARVLRPTGTFNHKTGTPRPVELLEHHPERRYNPIDFDGILLEMAKAERGAKKVDPGLVLAGIPAGSRDTELFKYAASLRARGLPREEAEVLVLVAADNCDPPFPREEALEKVRSAWKYQEGSERTQAREEAKAEVAGILEWNPEQIFTHETIGALATIKETDEIEYQRIKQGLKGTKKVSIRDLDSAVKKELANRKNIHLAEKGEERTPLEEVLKDIPIKGLRKPYAWTVNENGIAQATESGVIRACSVPVILTGKYDNIETGEEKIGLAWIHDGSWRSIIADGTIAFGNPAILQLRKKGLPVSSANARDLIQYLTELEYENRDILPRQRSVSHMGWAGRERFFPGAEGNVVLDVTDGLDIMAHAYREQGDIEDWQEVIRPLREYPLGRFVLAASFASPLLELLKQRVFLLHCWGSSTIGKTASMKAALSVWGDANATITNFNSTKVALERMANMRGSLPMGVDERQVMGDKQNYIDSLVYMLGAGKGKERGAKGGGMAGSTDWSCIVITNGEQPLTDDNSNAGLKTRCLEVTGPFIGDTKLADSLHTQTSVFFGTAGPKYIRAIIQKEIDDPKWIEAQFIMMQETLGKEFPETPSVHVAHTSIVVMGDFLSSLFVWGLEEEEAWLQAIDLARLILPQIESREQQQDARRSYEYIMSWLTTNQKHFLPDPPREEWYGFVDLSNNYVYILPHILKKALSEEGFNNKKALRDWWDNGFIVAPKGAQGLRDLLQQKVHPILKTKARYYVVKQNADTESPGPEETGEFDW